MLFLVCILVIRVLFNSTCSVFVTDVLSYQVTLQRVYSAKRGGGGGDGLYWVCASKHETSNQWCFNVGPLLG